MLPLVLLLGGAAVALALASGKEKRRPTDPIPTYPGGPWFDPVTGKTVPAPHAFAIPFEPSPTSPGHPNAGPWMPNPTPEGGFIPAGWPGPPLPDLSSLPWGGMQPGGMPSAPQPGEVLTLPGGGQWTVPSLPAEFPSLPSMSSIPWPGF